MSVIRLDEPRQDLLAAARSLVASVGHNDSTAALPRGMRRAIVAEIRKARPTFDAADRSDVFVASYFVRHLQK